MDWLSFVSEMTGHIMWPLLVVILACMFRGKLGDLIDRIKHIETPWGQAAFDRSKEIFDGAVALPGRPPEAIEPVSEPEEPTPTDSPKTANDADPPRVIDLGTNSSSVTAHGGTEHELARQVLAALDKLDGPPLALIDVPEGVLKWIELEEARRDALISAEHQHAGRVIRTYRQLVDSIDAEGWTLRGPAATRPGSIEAIAKNLHDHGAVGTDTMVRVSALEEMYRIARSQPQGIDDERATAFVARAELVRPDLLGAVHTAMARVRGMAEGYRRQQEEEEHGASS